MLVVFMANSVFLLARTFEFMRQQIYENLQKLNAPDSSILTILNYGHFRLLSLKLPLSKSPFPQTSPETYESVFFFNLLHSKS